jgi:predicted MFS family arabinose efflux permease
MFVSNRSESPVAVAIAGLVALAAALGIGRFVYTPILPVMAETLHLSKSQAGLIASTNLLGYLIGALLVATPRLPGSRRFWLLGSLGVSAVTTGTMGMVSSMPAFMALRFFGGAASAFVPPACLLRRRLLLIGKMRKDKPVLARATDDHPVSCRIDH